MGWFGLAWVVALTVLFVAIAWEARRVLHERIETHGGVVIRVVQRWSRAELYLDNRLVAASPIAPGAVTTLVGDGVQVRIHRSHARYGPDPAARIEIDGPRLVAASEVEGAAGALAPRQAARAVSPE